MQPEVLLNVAGNLSAVGFIIWLTHRLTTRTIPEMNGQYQQAASRQRDDFRDALKAQREDFSAFHAREHDAHEARLQSVMDKCLGRMRGED